ncbi:MAG: PSD1 and planctomycete cytochrome C domain-containing protein [Bryobacteraceae bacterium]|nr:PSD1 and planctomycete cytochrome C domain-containing protein [Bryobacteraceae bacterium]
MWRLILIGSILAARGYSQVDFARDVQPILRKNCYGCHGAAMQQSGFRLDHGPSALKGGYSGASIIPGDATKSTLIQRVSGEKGVPVMPPMGKRLTTEEVATLKRWIDAGAVFPSAAAAVRGTPRPKSKHWAFQPITKPQPPAIAGARHPIDQFVLARLAKESIKPSPEADKRVLLRRVSLDLIGLPPTPEELDAFLADPRPDAYERQVDRLLASPHFGEKWARHWLDQARYADSDGYEKDWIRPWAWRWRNWVIDSINRDQPFDEFTRDQIAGDLLPKPSNDQQVAPGFHRHTLTNREGGIDDNQFRFEATLDRASTVSTVWLGLTAGCAQCHDHKYDPISQKDLYSIFAFFDNVEEVNIDAPLPGEMGPWLRTNAQYRARREALLKEYNVAALQADWEKNILYTIAHPGERTDWDLAWDCVNKLTENGDGAKIVQIPPDQRTARERDILIDHFVGNYHFAIGNKKYKELKLDELNKKLRTLREEFPQLSQAMTIVESPKPKPTFLRVRGDYKANGIEVEPDTFGVLPPLKKSGARASRLDLARWITSSENPLTARVTVNRIWQELFGAGLARTPDDFGTRSDPPTHPELLDWLASEFRDQGWSRKQLIRTIVTSATYRQSSNARPDLQDRDPNNALLARQSRLRLPGELIRDSSLLASGLLTSQIGGPSVMPPIPSGVMELSYASRGWGVAWKESQGPDRYRRGLYIQFLRTTPYPLFVNFDAPKATVAACRRDRSNTPLQALNLLNDPVFLEAAQALSLRTLTGPHTDFAKRLDYAFQHALGRTPVLAEQQRLRRYYDQQQRLLADDAKAIEQLAPSAAPGATQLETAIWTGLSSILLNLDEFITRE